nr:unnamed protein product [Callosobruchus chinensis]
MYILSQNKVCMKKKRKQIVDNSADEYLRLKLNKDLQLIHYKDAQLAPHDGSTPTVHQPISNEGSIAVNCEQNNDSIGQETGNLHGPVRWGIVPEVVEVLCRNWGHPYYFFS